MARLIIVWDIEAKTSFKEWINYIKEDSLQNAQKVRSEILDIVDGLKLHPLKYPPDRFKISNDGNYRAFEKHNYRIAYKIDDQQIIILRLRHVRSEPKEH
ncbi:MAG: type II toxin-antitoxin system RelE/ParE family toxin [Cyclobacteriaceae bacterium]